MPDPYIAATPDGTTTYKFPLGKILQCVFYYETSGGDGGLLSYTLASRANALLVSHRLELRVHPRVRGVFGGGDFLFSYDQQIFSGTDDETASIFAAAKSVYNPPDDRLAVIFCRLAAGGTAGSTSTIPLSGPNKVVLIFINNPNADAVTLLHEIGHAAGLNHVPWQKDTTKAAPDAQNFMCTYGDLTDAEASLYSRSVIPRDSVVALGNAPFAIRPQDCSLNAL
jgi:hypothetical protein